MVSIIIPCFKDPYLQKTIDSLLENTEGKIEVIPILDGYTPDPPLKHDKRVKPIIFSENKGMRTAINAGIKKAKYKYIMKCDSHCIFGPGYDKILSQNCKADWLMIPRRYSLDEANWKKNEGRPVRDYHYFTYPIATGIYGPSLIVSDWLRKDRMDQKYDIDDTMIFQGSCWFANKSYFIKHIGFLDDNPKTYTPFGGEQLEVGLKYWLGGGSVKVIKKTWYAHLSKRGDHYRKRIFTRDYKVNKDALAGRTWAAKHWMNNEEPGMIHPISWLIEKFWPVPTWPEDRKKWVFPE